MSLPSSSSSSSGTDPAVALPMPPRRRALYALVAAAAGASGAGWAWWKFRPHGADTALDSEQTLWAQHFQTPDGAALAMQAFQGRPLVVNFWATWCPPCIAELPLLNDFFQQNSAQGWQVVGLAVDQPAAVRSFLARAPVHFPIGMAGLGGTELARALGNLTGGLPFTVVLGRGGQVLHRKIGQIKAQDLQRWRESSGG